MGSGGNSPPDLTLYGHNKSGFTASADGSSSVTPPGTSVAYVNAQKAAAASGIPWNDRANIGSNIAQTFVPLRLYKAFVGAGLDVETISVVDEWKRIVSQVKLSKRGGAGPPNDLFDYLAVAVLHHLAVETFRAFVKTEFFATYLQLRYFAYRSLGTLSHDDFDWLGRLGRGGYGSVYAARKRDTGKLYALKCMDKRLIKVRRATRLVVTERHILASVDNPFITGLKYAFHNQQEVVLVLEMMTGGDLEYYLVRKGRFAEPLARFYCAEVLLALKYLHEHGIMHRDLKPSNILLGTDGHIRLSDLGLSVFVGTPTVDLEERKTGARTGPVRRYCRGKAGTPGFWAPEMLLRDSEGKAGKYDHRADMWSFGCLLYALLAGRGPFTVIGGDTNDDNEATLHANPAMPPHIFSPAATSLLRGLMTKDPSRRLGCGRRGILEVMEHPFFKAVEWGLLAQKQVTPPWKPPHDSVTPDTSISTRDVQREQKLKAVMLTAQDHAHYCDIPFSSETSVEQEIVESLTLQATVAPISSSGSGYKDSKKSGRTSAVTNRSCVIS